jgi:hypothetical protein
VDDNAGTDLMDHVTGSGSIALNPAFKSRDRFQQLIFGRGLGSVAVRVEVLQRRQLTRE